MDRGVSRWSCRWRRTNASMRVTRVRWWESAGSATSTWCAIAAPSRSAATPPSRGALAGRKEPESVVRLVRNWVSSAPSLDHSHPPVQREEDRVHLGIELPDQPCGPPHLGRRTGQVHHVHRRQVQRSRHGAEPFRFVAADAHRVRALDLELVEAGQAANPTASAASTLVNVFMTSNMRAARRKCLGQESTVLDNEYPACPGAEVLARWCRMASSAFVAKVRGRQRAGRRTGGAS